jgi:hypothetical protein
MAFAERINAWYRPGDRSRCHNQNDVAAFGTVSANTAIPWVGLAKFDPGGTDRVLALSSTSIYSATPGVAGTFTSLISGLDASTVLASMTHAYDRWYLATGYDRNRVIESDGTVVFHGMVAPDTQLAVATANEAGNTASPTTGTGAGWDDSANAYDDDVETFAKCSLDDGDVTKQHVWSAWAADTNTGRRLNVKFSLAGSQQFDESYDTGASDSGGDLGLGGTTRAGWSVQITFEHSLDAGTTWQTRFFFENRLGPTPQVRTVQLEIPDQIDAVDFDLDQLQVRVSFRYAFGRNQATLRIHEIAVERGSPATAFTSTTGFYYTCTEYDSTRGWESAPGPDSALISLSTENKATLTLPTAQKNTNATHFIIYRTTDGGDRPNSYGKVGEAAIDATEFVDDFTDAPQDEQAYPLLRLYEITYERGTIYVPRDTAPPAFQFIGSFGGRVIGIPPSSRALHASISGNPHAYPETSVIVNFPLPENDRLVAAYEVGSVLVIAAEGAMMTLTEWPEGIRTLFKSEVDIINGVPGCVGQKAIIPFSIGGEDQLAWVSPFGLHITNGVRHDRISDSMEWEKEIAQENLSSASLYWDKQSLVLVLACNTRSSADIIDAPVTTPDVEYWFHMDHISDGKPLVTGPHPRPTNLIVGGLVSGIWRRYSAHPTDGTVKLWEGGTGAAMTLKSRRITADWNLFGIDKGSVRHGDFGHAIEGTVTVDTGRDGPGTTQTTGAKNVSLQSMKGSEFNVSLSCEWAEITVTTPAGSTGYIADVRFSGDKMAEAGGKATAA